MYRLQSLVNRGLIAGTRDQYAELKRVPGKWRSTVWRCGMERYSTAEATAASAALRKPKLREKTLSMENLNAQVKAVEYAVRGPIVIKAAEIERIIQQVIQQARVARFRFAWGRFHPPVKVNKLSGLAWLCGCIRKCRSLSPCCICALYVYWQICACA